MRLWPLLALLLAPSLRAAGTASPRTALERLLELEQSIPRGEGGQEKWETDFRKKTTAAILPLAGLLKAHGIKVETIPADWLTRRDRNYAWSGQEAWLSSAAALGDEQRCERVVLAYAFGLWQITGLTAEQPVNDVNDLLIRDYTDMDALWRDRARAAWAFRHIHAVPLAQTPPACVALVTEAAARWNFIFDSDKRPTGLARHMCGRPMNSHWDDDAIDEKKKPEPKGWSHPVD